MKATYQGITQGDMYKQLSKTKFTILFISLSTSSSFNAREAMAVFSRDSRSVPWGQRLQTIVTLVPRLPK